ncbi:MAG: accessory factor UbiK family protein [Alphaproteobacteria bacterium]|nr:accessory factor UbiK family protein [Alphaproteobacteria bacterium]
MPKNQTFVDDMMALGGSVLGNLLGARHDMRAQARQRMESLTQILDLVSRSEFDAAFGMLAKARATQEDLLERLEAVEAKLNLSSGKQGKKPKKQSLPSVKKGNRRTRRK